MSVLRQIILDTETTGFNHSDPDNPDRMIEFAGLEMKNRQFTDNNLHLYIHPERDIPEEAIQVHGITLDKLAGKPVFAEVAQQIFDYLQGAELIIHNAKFDVGFLNAEFARVGLPTVESICPNVIDTLQMARDAYPGQKNSLDALCLRLDVDRSKRVLHGALIDCELLGGVYLKMTQTQFSLTDQFDSISASAAAENRVPRPEYLRVLRASDEEVAAHEAYLDKLGETCLYRQNIVDKVTAE
ncbi:DNA polymerase III subunit epsilon [Wielerella bovis]|uniref:DNA polymerase III subunit epsilon n=1 Tax=Wielerella bovis TaxID=2917790 RepID=UPI0020185257|nr:DNA polymerase III subunit epsilon [Wielerella bovis]ULJ60253.1 DNA polymerase III subunit epsilon [Wielerella bovis]ULJ62460.1 DNA polymerase III subunit epsilon [Wielerella bovis]ULJ64685.1 DNA polymerase III subunit epsilon [Wielerella bovis]ULJ66957.1 DNA polymerase III subunit epsilon [Wielerella bovis]ULJ69178.1 DNA polymerase III subunit epsilon [Wielerella bovis]